MKIYDSQTAPNPRRVRIFLAEKGIKVPVRAGRHRQAAANRAPEFRVKNPLGTLPVLELDDGTCIAESVAICRYFEELHPDPPLMGTDARDRALVEMWQRRMELELFIPITQVFRNTHPFFAGRIPQVAEWGEVYRKTRRGAHGVARRRARRPRRSSPGSATPSPTSPRSAASTSAASARSASSPSSAHLARWHAAVSARPSAAACAAGHRAHALHRSRRTPRARGR